MRISLVFTLRERLFFYGNEVSLVRRRPLVNLSRLYLTYTLFCRYFFLSSVTSPWFYETSQVYSSAYCKMAAVGLQ